MRKRVAVVGVSGYSGLELMRLVLRHPAMDCISVMASEATGRKPLAEIHPQLRGLSRLTTETLDPIGLMATDCETVFLCTPNEVSYEIVPMLLESGLGVVDLSGSFRLRDASLYASWYGFTHGEPELLSVAAYGLTEWNGDAIRRAKLIANPGCYPTSVLLALLPLVRAGLLAPGSDIICDAKSGVTGAGRSGRPDLMYSEVSDSFRPYSPVKHRHAPEICQELGWDGDRFVFVPHLLPVNRGILSTLYVNLSRPTTAEELAEVYVRHYQHAPFIRLLGDSALPELRAVNYSNFCDIAWRVISGGRRVVVFSAIDNLIKGAAGQAVQNFNLMNGLNETVGLLEGDGLETHG